MTRLIQHRTIMRCLRSGGVSKQTEEKGENRISPFSFLLFHFVLLRRRRSSAGYWRQNWFERPGARFFNWRLFFAAAGRSSSLGIFDRQSCNDASDLHAIKRFVFEQNLSQADHRVAVLFDDSSRALVLFSDDLAHFRVDANRSLFGIVAVLRDLAAEEDLLLLLAEGQRPEFGHAVFTNHRPRQLGCFLDVVRRAGGDVPKKSLFGNAATHQD